MLKRTKESDLLELGPQVAEFYARAEKDPKQFSQVYYGKCMGNHTSGYFVDVYVKHPATVEGLNICGIGTKAGAKAIAETLGLVLSLPVQSDWS